MTAQRWIAETLFDELGFRMTFAVERVLYELATEHQHLVLFENKLFGKVLMLDGATQVTTRDEFIYHEMMTHVPILAHGRAREVLNLVIDDGMNFVERTERRFDVIIVDSTDPQGPGAVLFTYEFYAACRRCMGAGGIMVTQNGVPFFQPDELISSVGHFRKLFADAGCYVAAIPTYVGGHMAMGWAADDPASRALPVAILAERYAAAGKFPTRYWTPEVHRAAFALPRFIAEIMEKVRAE